jgi:hypothetical protein
MTTCVYYTRLTELSIIALDGRMFCLTSSANIRWHLEVLTDDIKVRND